MVTSASKGMLQTRGNESMLMQLPTPLDCISSAARLPPRNAPAANATPSSSVVNVTARISASCWHNSIKRLRPPSGTNAIIATRCALNKLYALSVHSAALGCSFIITIQNMSFALGNRLRRRAADLVIGRLYCSRHALFSRTRGQSLHLGRYFGDACFLIQPLRDGISHARAQFQHPGTQGAEGIRRQDRAMPRNDMLRLQLLQPLQRDNPVSYATAWRHGWHQFVEEQVAGK